MEINETLIKIEARLKAIEIKLNMLLTKASMAPLEQPEQSQLHAHAIVQDQPRTRVSLPEQAKPVEAPVVEAPVVEAPVVEAPVVPPKELVDLLHSKQWPHAVDPTLICDISSEQDKEDRAEGILDLIIDVSLENLRFLDFGCGEGHVINRSKLQNPKMAIGYDIEKSDKWKQWNLENGLLTTKWEDVQKNGPYNIVLMYDVIDHMMESNEDVISRLKEIKKMLVPGGKVFARLHPFCSRHGTHLYHQINKAFVHLVFTEEELNSLGYKQVPTRKVIHPIYEYNTLFNSVKFKIQSGPHQIKEGVEPFFTKNNTITQRIKKNYIDSHDIKFKSGVVFPSFQLEQQFIDYVLI